jgi:hypothetical protein
VIALLLTALLAAGQRTGLPTPTSDVSNNRVRATNSTTSRALKDRFKASVLDFIPTNLHASIAAGTNATDLTAYIQTAIGATRGRTLHWPKGLYKIASTVYITTRGNRWEGEFSDRYADGGTEIACYGTGPCIQIGAEHVGTNPATGLAYDWDDNLYDGPQGQQFENLTVRHWDPDSALSSAPASGNVYKASAYGIWDWYAGQILLRNVRFERFEASFVGVQSDINVFDTVYSHYSRFGVYLGPRSDQNSIRDLYAIYNDRAVTIDRATHTRLENAQLVACGTDTVSPIEIRRGASAVRIVRPWLEGMEVGFQGTRTSFLSIGEIDGYGPGGSIASPGASPTTTSVEGVVVSDAQAQTVISGPGHTRYFATVGKAKQVRISNSDGYFAAPIGNLDTLVAVLAGQAPTNTDTQVLVTGFEPGNATTTADVFMNLGAGSPSFSAHGNGWGGNASYASNRFRFYDVRHPAGAEEFTLSTEGQAGQFFVREPTYTGGQTTRLMLRRSIQHGAAAPASGAWEQGDRQLNQAPAVGTPLGWVNTASGSPGTWVPTYTANALGSITLNTGTGTATVATGAKCVCTDSTANASVKCAVSGTTLTATGTGSDAITYVCF